MQVTYLCLGIMWFSIASCIFHVYVLSLFWVLTALSAWTSRVSCMERFSHTRSHCRVSFPVLQNPHLHDEEELVTPIHTCGLQILKVCDVHEATQAETG